jgi:hypothetical protein
MNRNQIDNNIFGNLNRDEMRRLEAKVLQAPKIRLCSTYLTPSREIVPIAEALVAFDTATNSIIKFVAGFIPGNEFGGHMGKKYLISRKNIHGRHNPVCVKRGETVGDLKKFWNDQMLITHLDHDKLPWSCATAEYRVLRAYRQDIRAKARFELLTFHTPTTGDVDKRTMSPVWAGNNPPFALDKYVKGFFWWTQSLLSELSAFSGVDLMSHLTIHNKVVKEESPEMAAEMLHDHSEDDSQEIEDDASEPIDSIVSRTDTVAETVSVEEEEEPAAKQEIDDIEVDVEIPA